MTLLSLLDAYIPSDLAETDAAARMFRLYLVAGEKSLYRNHLPPEGPGHFTASALVISDDGGILLNHHKFLDKWLCFGGHADGNPEMEMVALREAAEESGIDGFIFVKDGIFDVDIHPIPENAGKGEVAHNHFDMCFLLRVAGRPEPVVSDESHEVRWFDMAEANRTLTDKRMRRMLSKLLTQPELYTARGTI